MYYIYTTPAFVFDVQDNGESSVFVWLYTKELGRVGATAYGIRKVKSKLRYSLQPYSLISVSLVRGKGGFRVVSAAPRRNYFWELSGKQRELALLLNMFTLLDRLVRGQSQDVELFRSCEEFFTNLAEDEHTSEELEGYNLFMILRVLEHLGYADLSNFEHLLTDAAAKRYQNLFSQKKDVIRYVNSALSSAHL